MKMILKQSVIRIKIEQILKVTKYVIDRIK